MIKEAYVSFEVAKLLKEKGFDEPIKCWYDNFQDFHEEGVRMSNTDCLPPTIMCPTHQMAMAWLREEKHITFIISPQWAEGDMRNPCHWYWEIRGLDDISIDVYSQPLCSTYEEAVEAACIYVLKNLL